LPYPPDGPGRPVAWGPDHLSQAAPFEAVFIPPPRRKFRHRWWLHITLLALTLAFTTLVGAFHYHSFASQFGRVGPPLVLSWGILVNVGFLLPGLWYSLTLLAILGAHEMGHYLYCRKYNIDASLPYFIPAPIPLTGTLGAVIRIREPFPTRKVLFDIGVAGPIAGFVVLVPALVLGMWLSNLVPIPTGPGVFYMGEPLLFQWVAALKFGAIPSNQTINIHPMVFAAWFGMLATALNLLPFGQLDGGHITYASVGRWSTSISLATVATAILLTYNSSSWMFMTGMMVVMLVLFGPRHPRVLYEYERLPASRYAVAILALVIFIICFTPVPIDTLIQ
jgi:membrane-associated protease RseP (regulator of RpoE activity)